MPDCYYLKQLTLFVENRKGRLAAITGALGEAGVNILAMSLADTADYGILRLILSDPEKATTVLRQNGFTVAVNDVLAVQVEDRPGGLAKVLHVLDAAGVNVEYLYAFTGEREGYATLAFRFDNPEEALRGLKHARFTLKEPAVH